MLTPPSRIKNVDAPPSLAVRWAQSSRSAPPREAVDTIPAEGLPPQHPLQPVGATCGAPGLNMEAIICLSRGI